MYNPVLPKTRIYLPETTLHLSPFRVCDCVDVDLDITVNELDGNGIVADSLLLIGEVQAIKSCKNRNQLANRITDIVRSHVGSRLISVLGTVEDGGTSNISWEQSGVEFFDLMEPERNQERIVVNQKVKVRLIDNLFNGEFDCCMEMVVKKGAIRKDAFMRFVQARFQSSVLCATPEQIAHGLVAIATNYNGHIVEMGVQVMLPTGYVSVDWNYRMESPSFPVEATWMQIRASRFCKPQAQQSAARV